MKVYVTRITISATLMLAVATHRAAGHPQDHGQSSPAAAQPTQTAGPSDRAVDASEPDFTLIGLPTTLRMPKFGSAFRVTHRFTRSLGQGNFGDLLSDGFGTDGGAQIGLEYRFGILSGTQIGVHRTSDKTIQFFGQQQLLRQSDTSPVGIDIIATIEGRNNFQEIYSPAIGAVVSRKLGPHGAVYAEPIWIGNTNSFDLVAGDSNDTFIVGLGGRIRIRPKLYFVAEAAPRFGYDPGIAYASFAVEMRAGGHSFQINFSDGFGTTMAQMARGGFDREDWYLGFNISRKFF
jgi:uncharacterized beta barrel domain-containing protein DUF5777